MMMRLVSFFALSVAVHAGALVYPVSFGGKPPMELLPVTILPMEAEAPAGISNGSNGGRGSKPGSKPLLRSQPTRSPKAESKPNSNPAPQALAMAPPSTTIDSGVPLAPATADSTEDSAAALANASSGGWHGVGAEAGGNGGSGPAVSGNGSGYGSGAGQGSSPIGIALTQARYLDTPTPNYPDSARRDGREGRVLLRVLIDEQGRSKHVEINSSSGSDVLDRAAAEAIKRWRFHPARYGDQPIESWLRVPIEFRLADAKSW